MTQHQCSEYYTHIDKPTKSFTMNYPKHIPSPLQSIDQNQCRHPSQPPFKPIKPKPISVPPFHPTSITPYSVQSVSIQRRNARERNRVKAVNDGFSNLRQHIPHEVVASLSAESSATHPGRGVNRKLSKVDTLKLTVEYIRRLQETLMMADAVPNSSQEYFEYKPQADDALQLQSENYSPATISPAPSTVSSDMSTSSYGASGYYSMPPINHHHPDFKHENFDSSDAQDEEILDCISWWQQQ